jgi:hypothetical protein
MPPSRAISQRRFLDNVLARALPPMRAKRRAASLSVMGSDRFEPVARIRKEVRGAELGFAADRRAKVDVVLGLASRAGVVGFVLELTDIRRGVPHGDVELRILPVFRQERHELQILYLDHKKIVQLTNGAIVLAGKQRASSRTGSASLLLTCQDERVEDIASSMLRAMENAKNNDPIVAGEFVDDDVGQLRNDQFIGTENRAAMANAREAAKPIHCGKYSFDDSFGR